LDKRSNLYGNMLFLQFYFFATPIGGYPNSPLGNCILPQVLILKSEFINLSKVGN